MAAEPMPEIIRVLCWGFDAWIVGSGATALVGDDTTTSDYDVIVPPQNWRGAALMLRTHPIIPNYFGGWKLVVTPLHIDVWPSTLEEFIMVVPSTYNLTMYHPKSRTIVTRTYKDVLSPQVEPPSS